MVESLKTSVGEAANEEQQTPASGLFAQIEAINERMKNKVDAVAGSRLMTEGEGRKLAALLNIRTHSDELAVTEEGELQIVGIEKDKVYGLPEALAARVSTIKVGEEILFAEEGEIEMPVAQNGKLGLVMGSEEDNSATVDEEGKIQVNKVSVSKLTQGEDELLVLNGGNATAY